MNRLLKWWLCVLLFFGIVCVLPQSVSGAEEELTAEQFVKRVRRPLPQLSYGKLSGEARHMRRGRDAETAKIELNIMFNPERTMAQLVLDGQEGYFIGQTYAAGRDGSTVTPMNDTGYPDSKLAEFGMRPDDLTLSFLYWRFDREFEPESVMTVSCRVLLFQSETTGEWVKAYVSKEYYYPLKAEWFPKGETEFKTPERTMEINSVQKENDYYLVKKLSIFGPGWATRIAFDKLEAAALDPDNPPNIFLTIGE